MCNDIHAINTNPFLCNNSLIVERELFRTRDRAGFKGVEALGQRRGGGP